KKDLPKVLMLGWEFPPVINGGLGVACHDLSSALSEFADITMIIPKSSPEFKMKNMKLVGLNTIDVNSLDNYHASASSQLPFAVHTVPSDINPYYSESYMQSQKQFVSDSTGSKSNVFSIDSLYGGDVIHKVEQYADIAAALAS